MWCAASWLLLRQLFPPEGLGKWLEEIASELAVSSRGRRNPRGVKRKMSGYPVRRGRAPTRSISYHAKIQRMNPK